MICKLLVGSVADKPPGPLDPNAKSPQVFPARAEFRESLARHKIDGKVYYQSINKTNVRV